MTIHETILLKGLEHICHGSLDITLPDRRRFTFRGEQSGTNAVIDLRDTNAVRSVVVQGDIGFAESYMRGEWTSPDLAAMLTFVCENVTALEQFYHGSRIFKILFSFLHRLNPNTQRGSRKNIEAHYDIGNEFYRLWLDDTMTYSSAIYRDASQTLEQAQHTKYGRLIERMQQESTCENVLEIGCGWGGFAESAAREGMHVTGLTISPSQAAFAADRMQREGLSSRADIVMRDYREVRGRFDSIVSIEMFEAVGERYWGAYFDTLKQRLKDGGKALIQTITIADDVFPHYRERGDFIQRHIFPGGMLPSNAVFSECARKVGMKIDDAFSFGRDYARTLGEWIARFEASHSQVRALGFSEEFIRKWRFYLAYCYGAFASGRTDVVQYELQHA